MAVTASLTFAINVEKTVPFMQSLMPKKSHSKIEWLSNFLIDIFKTM
jgi:hypothetical protein